jgi:uncharacterized protein DUF1360
MTQRYDEQDAVHLHSHSVALATYAASVAGVVAVGRATGGRVPERYASADLVVGAVAVHKLSRLLAKGSVTSPLRAPFTRLEEATGAAEHRDSARDESALRHGVGELLTCPFCLGVWLATAYVGGLALGPRTARTFAATFSVVAVSDWLQLGYEVLRDRAMKHD